MAIGGGRYGASGVIARGSYHFGKKESRFDPYLNGGLGVAHLYLTISVYTSKLA
jgi:outer membrane protein W